MFGFDTAFYLLVASYILSAIATPKAKSTSQAPVAMKDIDFPQPDEGTPQAVIFGDCWSGDWTILAVGDYRTSPIKSDGASKK